MLVASALGFIKVMALAKLMPPASFGNYGTVLGVAILSATLLSAGKVEGTIKFYPRLWVAGDLAGTRQHAVGVAGTLTWRFALVVGLLCLAATLFDIGYSPWVFLIGGLLGFANALATVMASLIRATGSARLLQSFSFRRAAIALPLSCGLGVTAGWTGALVGDAVATALTLVTCARAVGRHFPAGEGPTPTDHGGGVRLYIATLFSSTTGLADRAIVNLALGPAAAGAYGVIALMVQVGQLTSNIVAQRVGPAVIKAFHSGEGRGTGLRTLVVPCTGLVALAVLLIGAMLAMWRFDLPPGFLSDYGIGPMAIWLGGALVALQIFSLMEFLLIARDQERYILLAGGVAAGAFFALFGLAAFMHWPVEAFIAAAVKARGLHVALLIVLTRRATHRIAAGGGSDGRA